MLGWSLCPPRSFVGAEVCFRPRSKGNGIVIGNGSVSQGQRLGCGAADDFTSAVVLRTVTGTHEFVLGVVPRNDTTEVSTNGVDAVVANGAAISYHEIGRIAF
jgi:hypothetical protein